MIKVLIKVILLLLVFIVGGCTSSIRDTYHQEQLVRIQKLGVITSNNGVNQEEAYLIAGAVFSNKISACGFPLEPVSKGGYWVSETAVGFGGDPGPLIFIDKFTGTATWDWHTQFNSDIKTQSLTLDDLKKLDMYVFTNSILKYMY